MQQYVANVFLPYQIDLMLGQYTFISYRRLDLIGLKIGKYNFNIFSN